MAVRTPGFMERMARMGLGIVQPFQGVAVLAQLLQAAWAPLGRPLVQHALHVGEPHTPSSGQCWVWAWVWSDPSAVKGSGLPWGGPLCSMLSMLIRRIFRLLRSASICLGLLQSAQLLQGAGDPLGRPLVQHALHVGEPDVPRVGRRSWLVVDQGGAYGLDVLECALKAVLPHSSMCVAAVARLQGLHVGDLP